jgi:putative FmdB family regulatory protein
VPTYSYACDRCKRELEIVRSISDYIANPNPLFCCGVAMQRRITVAPGLAVHNPLAGDRAYDGLRTPEGVDVSSRTKHRAYMKERGLTTADDFKGQWKRAAEQRAEEMSGTDPTRRDDIARALDKLQRGST